MAGQFVGTTEVDSAALRSTLVYGDADDIEPSFATYRTRPGGTEWVLGDGRQRVSLVVHVDELTEVIDAGRSRPQRADGDCRHREAERWAAVCDGPCR
jgi:hypothetical protein